MHATIKDPCIHNLRCGIDSSVCRVGTEDRADCGCERPWTCGSATSLGDTIPGIFSVEHNQSVFCVSWRPMRRTLQATNGWSCLPMWSFAHRQISWEIRSKNYNSVVIVNKSWAQFENIMIEIWKFQDANHLRSQLTHRCSEVLHWVLGGLRKMKLLAQSWIALRFQLNGNLPYNLYSHPVHEDWLKLRRHASWKSL